MLKEKPKRITKYYFWHQNRKGGIVHEGVSFQVDSTDLGEREATELLAGMELERFIIQGGDGFDR